MTISNTRIQDISGGTVYHLVDMPIKFIWDYNPELQEADVRVEFIQMLDVDGATRNVNMGSVGSTHRGYADIQTFQPCTNAEVDPNTGADLTDISIQGMMVLMGEMFDKMHAQDNA